MSGTTAGLLHTNHSQEQQILKQYALLVFQLQVDADVWLHTDTAETQQ